jgi:hypothetical protein
MSLRLLAGSLFSLIVAALVAVGLTWVAVEHDLAFGAVTIGSWTATPQRGTTEIDPYARAYMSRSGQLPLNVGDGLAYSARVDDSGKPLDGHCDVTVEGLTPQARFWTLTLYDPAGRLVPSVTGRHDFTSAEVVRRGDGSFTVTVAPEARAGNWLPSGGIDRYILMLRLYDTPLGIARQTVREIAMPSIKTLGCS